MTDNLPIITRVEFFEAESLPRPLVEVSARPFSSLSIRHNGKITVKADGRTLLSASDTLTFIPGGCNYATEILEGGKMSIMHFYTTGESGNLSDAPLCTLPPFPLSFYNLFGNAIRHFNAEGCDLFCMSAAYEILCEAQSVFFRHAPAPPRRMLRCKEYLDENVCDTSLRIGTLAKMCGVSEVYFRREFKSCYGTSPLEYIKRRRIEVACQLLSTGLYNVTQVAERAGFDSISYFSAEFRRLKGCTPSQYFNK